MPGNDEFLTGLYDRLHRTPMQEKFRRLAPMPVGVVFIERPGMTDAAIRGHFRRMKELGFTCLKGIHLCPGTPPDKVQHMALDEGLIPWWYDEGGWEEITDALLGRLGIPPDTPIEKIRTDPRMLAHQEQVMRARIDAAARRPARRGATEPDAGFSFDMTLAKKAVPALVAWLKKAYGTPAALMQAWNMDHAMIRGPARPWRSWRDVGRDVPAMLADGREYRRLRDLVRFKADLLLERIRRRADADRKADPHAPTRAGGEMGLFLPFAARATDMEGIARLMAGFGSFYPSIHLAWHFEEVDFEVARPVYMQASLAQDWFKGGWAATWESTGGPQQLSGGKAWTPEAAARTAGFTVDGGVMAQLMLSYLAAGFKGFGFWCWDARTAGWEAGEYALLDRHLQPTDRAIQAGRIGQAARRWRDELWQARKEPLVGLFTDFENDALWAAISVRGRDKFKHVPMQARVGAARALINANVPWEHVTGSDLRQGLADRYRVIYLPAVIALAPRLLDVLMNYVARGGRAVLDMPGAWYDDFGRLLETGPGRPPEGAGPAFEKTFGCTIRDMQYSSNVPRSLGGRRLEGFVADLGLTRARAAAAFDAGSGSPSPLAGEGRGEGAPGDRPRAAGHPHPAAPPSPIKGEGAQCPAVAEATLRKGTACVLACEAALACFRPGNAQAEALLVRHALGPHESPYACREAIVYRLAAPAADHYFFVNDGPATEATLDTKSYRYARAADAVTGEELALGAPIPLPPHSGRWLRCEKV